MRKVYHEVAKLADIALGTCVTARLDDGEECVVFRTQDDRIHATGPLCPHQNEPLDLGHLEGSEVICRRHHLRFDIRTGDCTNAGGYSLRVYEVKVEEGAILVGRWED